MTTDLLLEIKDLKTYFYLYEGVVRAVDGVDLRIHRGEVLGIIGESGCGKSVTAKSILRIEPSPPGRIVSGQILLHRGRPEEPKPLDLVTLDPKGKQIRDIRGKEMSMIFQEPMNSFGPLHTVGNQISEAIMLHQPEHTKAISRELTIELLKKVGIPMPHKNVDSYPHQLSGGMRQRAMIAMALSCEPGLLIADEPTTALDVTIQAQILELLFELREEMGMAIMFITHNLGVIAEIAANVAVMYLGRVVEYSTVFEIFDNPLHPYTQALMKSIPRIDTDEKGRLLAIEGVVPDPYQVSPGCTFADRCRHYIAGTCDRGVPALVDNGESHHVRCFLYSPDHESHEVLDAHGESGNA